MLALFAYSDLSASMACLLELQRFFHSIGFPKVRRCCPTH